MICSPEFIKVYNETFKFIAVHAYPCGKATVEEYWRQIAPIALADLEIALGHELIMPRGKGCGLNYAKEYWDKTLTAEGAVYSIDSGLYFLSSPSTEYAPPIEDMTLNIYECPSLRILGDKAYEHYCDHCTVMYKPLFDKRGYDYEVERKERGCKIRITKRKSASSETADTPEAAST